MIFNREKQFKWKDSKQYLKSTTDLKLLPKQVIYVEGRYNEKINTTINKKYDEIYAKFKSSGLSAEFIYLPFVARQLHRSDSLFYILKYYFPAIDKLIYSQNNIHSVFRTYLISQPFFSGLGYNAPIHPGFFRYVGKDKENLFVYEYFTFTGSNKSSILKQIDYYVNSIIETQDVSISLPAEEEDLLFDDMSGGENILDRDHIEEQQVSPLKREKADLLPFPEDFFEKEINKSTYDDRSSVFDEDHLLIEKKSPMKARRRFPRARKPLFDNFFGDDSPKYDNKKVKDFETLAAPVVFEEDNFLEKKSSISEHDLIAQIKSNIQKLKKLGFYELLIKELVNILIKQETNRMFIPSRLFVDEEFRIYLPDFNNMEITMTPLPKTLFIFFLRHPEGINLKLLMDCRTELLEIYKLLSNREIYFDIVESINRICNPSEGSINEKLSRIKEAFLKKMSMDTAKYYIVAGKRGMKKKIEIDRSLIKLPKVFGELELTKIAE
jgi:hypothetical protein